MMCSSRSGHRLKWIPSICIMTITLVVVYIHILRSRDLEKVQAIQPGGPLLLPLDVILPPDANHFHLRSLKKMLVRKALFGAAINSSGELYNFGGLARFRTKFYKEGNGYLDIGLQAYMELEFKRFDWYTRNLRLMSLDDPTDVCLYTASTYFSYKFRYLGNVAVNPTRVLLLVTETVVNYDVHNILLPDIFADVTTGRTRATCRTVGGYRHKYYIECPLLETDFVISIKGSYLAPSMYRYKCRMKDSWLLKEIRLDVLEEMSIMSIPFDISPTIDLRKCNPDADYTGLLVYNGYWIRRDGVWYWPSYGCYYDFTISHKTKACLKKKNIYMMGDTCMGHKTEAINNNMALNLTHIFTTFTSHHVAKVRELAELTRNQENVVFVMSSGNWSLGTYGIAEYIPSMIELYSVLEELVTRTPPVQVIWLENTAYPDDKWHSRWRNNLVIEAMNDWINHNMGILGVPVVNAYDISRPMRSEMRVVGCYHDILGDEVISNTINVGGAIDTVLLQTICH